tara:strand:- start:51 stop:497 length:447 start_codon:yes stop_codon:yes gene_type:complete
MAFKDWSIWKKFAKPHGGNGHEALREIFTNDRFTDLDILRKYSEINLSNEQITIIRLIYQVEQLENKINSIQFTNTESKSNNTNKHKGIFVVVDEDGDYIQYRKGDIVTYNNKTYIANRKIELGMGPLHEDSGWKEITAETIEGGEFN